VVWAAAVRAEAMRRAEGTSRERTEEIIERDLGCKIVSRDRRVGRSGAGLWWLSGGWPREWDNDSTEKTGDRV
jgi:hypothetical protein